jgi:hypothetical protein
MRLAVRCQVRESACLVLVQTRRVLERPWCIIEMLTAMQAGIPIVCVVPVGQLASEYTHLRQESNPQSPGLARSAC